MAKNTAAEFLKTTANVLAGSTLQETRRLRALRYLRECLNRRDQFDTEFAANAQADIKILSACQPGALKNLH